MIANYRDISHLNTIIPSFLFIAISTRLYSASATVLIVSPVCIQVSAGYRDYYCCDRAAAWQHDSASRCGSDEAHACLLYGVGTVADIKWQCSRRYFWPSDVGGLSAVSPRHGYSAISIPGFNDVIVNFCRLCNTE